MINAKTFRAIRKSVLILSQLILIIALGCGQEPTAIIITFPTETGTPTLTPEPTETEFPTATLEPSETPFVPAAVIKIFSHVPLSGEQAVYGQDILHASELAVQQLSAPFSEYRFKVELVPFDDQNRAATALANARQIVADPEILCGIGHYDSDVTIQASDIYHQAGLAFVAPAVTAPLLTERNYFEVNRALGHRDGQGAAAAQFAAEQEFASVYVISQQGEDSLRNAEYFRREVDQLGIQVLGMAVTALNSQTTPKLVSQVINTKADLVYISAPADESLPFLNALRAAGYKGALLGTEELRDASILDQSDAALVAGGLYHTVIIPPLEYFVDAAQFIDDFETQYETTPSSLAALAYDATGICLRAIHRAAKSKGGVLPTRDEVAKAIRRLKGYKGLTGSFVFNDRGDLALTQYYVVQIKSVDTASLDQNSVVASYEVAPP